MGPKDQVMIPMGFFAVQKITQSLHYHPQKTNPEKLLTQKIGRFSQKFEKVQFREGKLGKKH